MKLQTYEHPEAPVASALSVSLSETAQVPVKRLKNSNKEQEDLWQEITEELASSSAPLWRMWR
jgi:hypothetical protein